MYKNSTLIICPSAGRQRSSSQSEEEVGVKRARWQDEPGNRFFFFLMRFSVTTARSIQKSHVIFSLKCNTRLRFSQTEWRQQDGTGAAATRRRSSCWRWPSGWARSGRRWPSIWNWAPVSWTTSRRRRRTWPCRSWGCWCCGGTGGRRGRQRCGTCGRTWRTWTTCPTRSARSCKVENELRFTAWTVTVKCVSSNG